MDRTPPERDVVLVGGALPGTVEWLDDHYAIVTCDGHSDPIAVYEAACHEGADLDDVTAEPITSGADAGGWLVGPSESAAE